MTLMAKLKERLKATTAAATEVTGGVDHLRDRLEELRDERKHVEALPVLREDAVAALDRDLDRLVSNAFRGFQTSSLTRSSAPALPSLDPETAVQLLLSANVEGVRALLVAEIDKTYASDEGISAEDRKAELARIDAEVEEIERAEELLIRTAEAAGVEILRRADPWPDALLMTDEALA